MIQLTDSMIINSLNTILPSLKSELIFLGVLFLSIGILNFIKFKREKTTRGKSIIIVIVISLLLIGIPVFKAFLKYNAINYSVKNNSWYVATDIVERRKISTSFEDAFYYIYLSEYGKISVSRKTYYDLLNSDSVYVLIVKGRLGGIYATNQIYPTDEYIYKK